MLQEKAQKHWEPIATHLEHCLLPLGGKLLQLVTALSQMVPAIPVTLEQSPLVPMPTPEPKAVVIQPLR